MNLAEKLQGLKLAVKKDDKKAYLAQMASDSEFQAALQYRFNPTININLTAKEIRTTVKPNPGIHTINNLNDAINQRQWTKPERQALAQSLLVQYTGEDNAIIVDLLTKELALGVGVKTINQVYGKVIPEFNVQLAYPYAKKIGQYSDDDVFYVTQKLDGHRNLTEVEPTDHGYEITIFSRTGQIRQGMTELRTAVRQFMDDNADLLKAFPKGIALDGELLAINDDNLSTVDLFQKTSDILQQETEKQGLQYNVFDMVPLDEFRNQKQSKETYAYRREAWLNHLAGNQLINIIPVLAKITKHEIHKWSTYATDRGWEGVMLNLAKGVYKEKRSNQLLKVKKMHTADLPIIGFNVDGNYLQTINVRLDEHTVVGVGSGLTDSLRAEIMADPDKYIDTMCEVQYFEEMKNNTGHTLRFPVFKAFRFDKTTEDVNVE